MADKDASRPQSVRCDYCFQPAGHACITAWGRRAHYSHAVRKRDAKGDDRG